MLKKVARIKRAMKTRHTIRRLDVPRLCVHRTLQHIYAQVISANGAEVIACASTLDKTVLAAVKGKGKIALAQAVGEEVAKRAKEKGISSVAFDRSGFKYHGRVKALADAAREHGLLF